MLLKKRHVFNLVLAISLMMATISYAAVETGEIAPDFILQDVHGVTHELSQYEGKFVVLEWLNPDCPFVIKHYDSYNMQDLQAEFTEEGVIWLSIVSSASGKQGSYEPAEQAKINAEKEGMQTAVLLDTDGSVGRLYDAKTTPHMFVIDQGGMIIYQGAIDSIAGTDPGEIEESENYVRSALYEAMEGEVVSISTTRPYGCSVKY